MHKKKFEKLRMFCLYWPAILILGGDPKNIQKKICRRSVLAPISHRISWPYRHIFIAQFVDTHIGFCQSQKPHGYIAIWSYYGHMANQPYGSMAQRVANMGVYRKSNKNVAIWSRDWIDWTILWEMRAKALRRHIFLCIILGFPWNDNGWRS